ncbi:porin [Halomonas sp. G15]|uniref:porin n=1 Tax=Halomonas sp. G15 TaxID=2903521 RepID=UPI001E4BCE59|nr:porin [Halomonas sp. G15]MCE0732527.1 porin [Halomonas sp. G15]
MKKTLLATAIAGAMVASGAQAATIYNQDGTKLDLYGNIQIAYRSIEKNVADAGDPRDVQSQDDLFDNGSTVGLSGEHVINPGLTGYFKAEWEHDVDEAKDAGGIDTGDQAYMGLKGNFGDARVGSWDPLIDDWIQDPITNNEYFDASDSSSYSFSTEHKAKREGNKLSYTSPSLAGFQFAVGTQYEGDAEGENLTDSGNASAFGGLKYSAGAFSVAAVYDNLDNYQAEFDDGSDYELGEQYGITAQYAWNTLRVSAKVERFESDNTDLIDDANFYALGARYGYGNGMGDIYGAYQYVDVGGGKLLDALDDATGGDSPSDLNEDRGDDSYNEIVLGATYNVSDAMYTFVEAAWYDREDDEKDGVAVGAVYMF